MKIVKYSPAPKKAIWSFVSIFPVTVVGIPCNITRVPSFSWKHVCVICFPPPDSAEANSARTAFSQVLNVIFATPSKI